MSPRPHTGKARPTYLRSPMPTSATPLFDKPKPPTQRGGRAAPEPRRSRLPPATATPGIQPRRLYASDGTLLPPPRAPPRTRRGCVLSHRGLHADARRSEQGGCRRELVLCECFGGEGGEAERASRSAVAGGPPEEGSLDLVAL